MDTSNQPPLSQLVVEAVAEREGVAPEDLCLPDYDPLHEAIDPNALDALFAAKADGTPRSDGRVIFSFCGYEVTIDSDGSVTLE